MSKRIEGKKILVTAAGNGMGREAALNLVREGAEVWATDIDAGALADMKSEKLHTDVLDVRDTAAIKALTSGKEFDAVFNCAGIVHAGSLLEASDDEWQLAFEVNVLGMANVIKHTLPPMLEKEAGSIINMASVVSSMVGAPGRAIYGSTKAAVIGLTKSVAKEYVSQGIRCNALCPGTVNTPSLRQRLEATGDYDKAFKEFSSRQPMGFIAEASDIIPVVTYLASDESRFVTGQTIALDGGWSS